MSQPSFDLDLDTDDGGLPTFTVGELAEQINATLRRGFYEGVWVRGEIQGWREGPNGHAYFNLVDDTGSTKATIAVSFFANNRMKLRPLLSRHRLRLGDGMKIRIHGFLDFYAPNGRLGLKMGGIDPRYTLGEIALARDDLVRRLIADGLYDRQRALTLPQVPLRVGVVTSVGSAAWHDFTHELEASGFGFRLFVADVRVQGEWAIAMVARAIGALAERAETLRLDAIVVVRGGGARSDLAAFDAEAVARAISHSPVPVLTGLGHEIDRSVADEVAHRSLKTPTACAAALVEAVVAFHDSVEAVWSAISAQAARHLSITSQRLTEVSSRIALRTRSGLALADERLDRHVARLPVVGRRVLDGQRSAIERAAGRTAGEARRHLAVAALRIDAVEGRVRALDPAATLQRGWSITRRADGALVRHPDDAPEGEEIVTMVSGGELRSRVERQGDV